ncbi:hypothetical protein H704_00201 [Bartonella bacilliformis Peru38]|nr:hypothetical protein H704_00201 [Bartonella bacilliformis Peru38]
MNGGHDAEGCDAEGCDAGEMIPGAMQGLYEYGPRVGQ